VPGATPKHEATVSKITSLVVKFGALIFVLSLDRQNAINLQLLGGVWILQTFVSIVGGLYTRWLHRWALLAGWAVAMVYGTWKAYDVASPATKHFGGSTSKIEIVGQIGYIGLTSVVINIIVAVVLTVVLRALKTPEGEDITTAEDYHADAGDPRVSEIPELTT
jgi:solute:Na+ symporter, SSS family